MSVSKRVRSDRVCCGLRDAVGLSEREEKRDERRGGGCSTGWMDAPMDAPQFV